MALEGQLVVDPSIVEIIRIKRFREHRPNKFLSTAVLD